MRVSKVYNSLTPQKFLNSKPQLQTIQEPATVNIQEKVNEEEEGEEITEEIDEELQDIKL